MTKLTTCTGFAIMTFANKHRISFDYLVAGDLRGLKKTMQGSRQR